MAKFNVLMRAGVPVHEVVEITDVQKWLRDAAVEFIRTRPDLRSFSIFSSVEDIDTFKHFVPLEGLEFPHHCGIALWVQGRVWYKWIIVQTTEEDPV